MAQPNKKRDSLEIKQGRPKKGALSTYPKKLLHLISKIRSQHEGWGADSILVELILEFDYSKKELPSVAAVNRYLKEKRFVKEQIQASRIPSEKSLSKIRSFHDKWEMDAQGAVFVQGVGHIAPINVKDTKSKIHCISFPVHVKGSMSQPKTQHYFWALRLAFEQWGLPKVIQVDKDSVFIDNKSRSPFPSKVHLWLIGLGVRLDFIKMPPPLKQAMVERSHQTMDKQAMEGQKYDCWKQLFKFFNQRLQRLNEYLPNRMLGKKAPLEAFPKAIHSKRPYQVEQEFELIDLRKIFKFLAKCCWYRKVSKVKTISLNGQVYYLKAAQPYESVKIIFCNRAKKLVFRNAKELVIAKFPIRDFSLETITGASSKVLISTKKKLFRARDFPL